MKIWMTMKDFAKYEELRREMRSLPAELRRILRDAPPVRCQLFTGRTSEISWSKFIAANDGKLSTEIANWEKWERLPENMGYCRFFGRGSQQDLDLVEKAFTRGDEILKEYDAMYPVLEELEWKLPEHWGYYPEEEPDHLSLLRLLGEFTEGVAYYGNGDGILLEEAGMEVVVGEQDEKDEFFFGPPGRLQRVGLDMRSINDLAAAFEEAVDRWFVPYDREWVMFQIQKAEAKPIPPVEAKPEPAPPVIESAVFRKGHKGLHLVSNSGAVFQVPPKYTAMFTLFLEQVDENGAGEPVPWGDLNRCVGADATGPKTGKPVASDRLRKVKGVLNERMRKWGRPPVGEEWIVLSDDGYALNGSCKWFVDEELKRRVSGWSHFQDRRRMEEDQPDKDHKLPARPFHPKSLRDDEDDEDDE